ncbi:MAG: single-stranded DNA-binding protein [Candidatus Coprovivens sp.]
MLNQLVIVGRIAKDIELKESENGKKYTNMILAIPRTFKNVNGEYDTDFLTVTLFEGIAENTAQYCKPGDLIGIKGRIQNRPYSGSDENIKYLMEIVAEKVTFLSSKKEDENGQDL